MKFISQSLSDTSAFAQRVASTLQVGNSGAVVLALYGELGAGKTAFTQGLYRAYGIRDFVQSPTFVLMKRYVPKGGPFSKLIHIDAYRLEQPDELSRLSFDALLKEPGTLIVVEWADRVEPLLPANTIRMKFLHVDEQSREIDSPFS